MRMFVPLLAAVLAICLPVFGSSNAIGSKGYYNISTSAFTLELDVANQVATRLIALPGSNSGDAPFDFLLPAANRTDDGYYVSLLAPNTKLQSDGVEYLGDIQIRMRPQNNNTWTDLSSHYAREAVNTTKGSGNVLTTSDITASLGNDLPITVQRTWIKQKDSIVMKFKITNVGTQPLVFGGVGIPMAYNNDWINKDQEATWTESVISDPAISLDGGYVITNRLTGNPPTLVTAPVHKTPLEQYRLNYNQQPDYPVQWLDKLGLDFNYEGIFSWWMASSGLTPLDTQEADDYSFTRGSDWNTPTSFSLKPRASRIIGLRLFTAAGPRQVEDRLTSFGRPTIVGVPGFAVPAGEDVKLLIRSTSAPSISNVSPAIIQFNEPTLLSSGFYSVTGTAAAGAFGKALTTIKFANGEVATAHYNVLSPFATQMDNLGEFRFSKQYFTNTSDYFHRAPSVITYDHEKMEMVTDDPRAWVAGLSDEAGTGAYVSAAAKQLGRPNKQEISMLEDFATQTLFGEIQIASPGSTYGGVKKSIFYYDANLTGVYDPNIDHSGTWPKSEADLLSRSYDYPHPTVVYWVLYRLARNYVGLTKNPWTWYLDRAYDTIIGMQNNAGLDAYAQFGLMEGTYFQMVLLDLLREGDTNQTLATRAQNVSDFMKQRADIWNGETYPYASEFPWDNTAQEEVYVWTSYFGYTSQAAATVETLMALMASVPHWGYSGTGRDLWDFLYSGQYGPGARLERLLHHYKGAQSALPLMYQFQLFPTDIHMLRAGYGGVIGPLTSIGEDGFGATGFHSRPDYLNWDPLSGDNGVTIALHALTTRAILVNDTSVGGWAGFGGAITQSGNKISIRPTDSFRQRVFIADNALYMELDAGHFTSVAYDTSDRTVTIALDANDGYTPHARLRWSTTATTASSGNYTTSKNYKTVRGCAVVPLKKGGSTTVVLNQ